MYIFKLFFKKDKSDKLLNLKLKSKRIERIQSKNVKVFMLAKRQYLISLENRTKFQTEGEIIAECTLTYSAFRLKHLQYSVAIQVVVAVAAEQVVGVLAVMLFVPMLFVEPVYY